MPPIKLISTDFDGTLFAEFEQPPVPPALQRVIRKLQERGTKWVINTGRDMSSLMEALARSGLEVQPDFLVLVEREVYLHQDSRYLEIDPWNTECHNDHSTLFEAITPHLPQLVDWINERFQATIYADAFSPFCIIANSNHDMDEIHERLDAFCLGFPKLTVVRNDVYARFSHARYNKGTALREIMNRLAIGPGEVFAAGDHLNDLPMLRQEFAHWLAAPANAIAQVKRQVCQEGGRVSARGCGEGVLEVLSAYLKELGWCEV